VTIYYMTVLNRLLFKKTLIPNKFTSHICYYVKATGHG